MAGGRHLVFWILFVGIAPLMAKDLAVRLVLVCDLWCLAVWPLLVVVTTGSHVMLMTVTHIVRLVWESFFLVALFC